MHSRLILMEGGHRQGWPWEKWCPGQTCCWYSFFALNFSISESFRNKVPGGTVGLDRETCFLKASPRDGQAGQGEKSSGQGAWGAVGQGGTGVCVQLPLDHGTLCSCLPIRPALGGHLLLRHDRIVKIYYKKRHVREKGTESWERSALLLHYSRA